MLPLVLLVTLALLGISSVTLLNSLTFPRLRVLKDQSKHPLPKLSVLIPARDEAAVIGLSVRSLLEQEYPDLEVIVLDDHSSDGTGLRAQQAGQGDSRLRLLQGAELPPGWLGKNWACQQLGAAAQGDLLLFCDADVRWAPGALLSLAHMAQESGADLLTAWPTQETVTWSERLVVPLMALAIIAYLPLLAVHHLPWASFAAANGQCLLFRRSSYQKLGGHAAVRASVVEDISLARRIKQAGLRLRMADGAGLVQCRMYRGWTQVRDGYAKNILAGHGGRLSLLLLSSLFHWLVFLGPWVWLLLGWINPTWPLGSSAAWPLWPLLLVALGVGVRGLSAAVTRQRAADALLLPFSVLLMSGIAAQATWWQLRYGGPQWKGRSIRLQAEDL